MGKTIKYYDIRSSMSAAIKVILVKVQLDFNFVYIMDRYTCTKSC